MPPINYTLMLTQKFLGNFLRKCKDDHVKQMISLVYLRFYEILKNIYSLILKNVINEEQPRKNEKIHIIQFRLKQVLSLQQQV